MKPVAIVLLLALLESAQACIYEYGTRHEAAELAGGNYTYAYHGLDWGSNFPQCKGRRQSPLLLPAATGLAVQRVPRIKAKSTFSYGKLTDPVIVNNGHTLQVTMPSGFQSDVKIPVAGDKQKATAVSVLNGTGPISFVKATPAQLHFHTHSEHVISGASYPLEMHIVHFIQPDQLPACPAPSGCPVVLGIFFALTDREDEVSPELRRLIEAMPLNEGQSQTVKGTVDVNELLPSSRTYFTYEGSLTTPPCTEGLLWHVLATPMRITQSLLTRYEEAVGDYNCPGQHAAAASSSSSAKANFELPPADKGDAATAVGTSIVTAATGTVSFVKATPAQFHFHGRSEHVVSGVLYPLEMHIVHFIKPDQLPACPAPSGCPVVLGVMLELTDKENEVPGALRSIINAMPVDEGHNATISASFSVNDLLPKDHSYFTYSGSLTAPPCT
eukprot:gene3382-3656_t